MAELEPGDFGYWEEEPVVKEAEKIVDGEIKEIFGAMAKTIKKLTLAVKAFSEEMNKPDE